jgi:hypothetical protein
LSSGPIKIGMVTSLTGNYAPLGTNDKLAAQQIVDAVNAKKTASTGARSSWTSSTMDQTRTRVSFSSTRSSATVSWQCSGHRNPQQYGTDRFYRWRRSCDAGTLCQVDEELTVDDSG